jgi:RimJ/RimL family protein N-acetyltransferase
MSESSQPLRGQPPVAFEGPSTQPATECSVRCETFGVVELAPLSDGVVMIRPPTAGDLELLLAGRDDEFHRWLGPGAASPWPTGCIVVEERIIGWVDYDLDREWLGPGEVNVGYSVFAPHRGKGYATRAVELLMRHLENDTPHRTATLLIDPENQRSLAVAGRTNFRAWGELNGQRYFKRSLRR